MNAQVASFISRRWCVPKTSLHVELQPLGGGLESVVTLARISNDRPCASTPRRMVIKELRAGCEREADIYEVLWRHVEQPPVVRVLGRERSGRTTYLYLEEAQSCSPWPWADTSFAAAVCRELARLHDSHGLPQTRFSWNYEAELAASAEATLQLAGIARDERGRRYWRRLGDLRRVVAALPAIRSRLLTAGDRTVIHGDMHPGNVIVRRGCPTPQVVLIDWGRARLGSPLEDVASWLHALGCWEPEAMRRHDTLMRAYLDARQLRRPFASDLRRDTVLASASNGLSGAIRHHLAVLVDDVSPSRARSNSRHALMAWERVVRRAAAIISTSRARCM